MRLFYWSEARLGSATDILFTKYCSRWYGGMRTRADVCIEHAIMEKDEVRYPVSPPEIYKLEYNQTMPLILTVLAIFVLLVINELWWRKRHTHNEFSRKFIHITVGSFVAFWPFFLEWDQIKLLSIAFIVVVLVSKQLKIFQAIHSVQRPTHGELLFAAAVGALALISQNEWIYMAAVLQMSLADGMAAIVGTRFGNQTKYMVFGHTKSIYGTVTFLVISIAILLVFTAFSGIILSLPIIVGIALVASLIENVSVEGIDNLLVPVFVAAALHALS